MPIFLKTHHKKHSNSSLFMIMRFLEMKIYSCIKCSQNGPWRHQLTTHPTQFLDLDVFYFEFTSIPLRLHIEFTSISLRVQFDFISDGFPILGGAPAPPQTFPFTWGGLPPPHTLLLFTSAFGPPDRNSIESRQSCLRIKNDYH